MAELTLERTYATALFEVAEEVGKVDVILQDLRDLQSLFESIKEFTLFFRAPTVAAAEKKKVLSEVFEGQLQTETLHFLYVLVDKGRAAHFERIVKSYETLVEEAEGYTLGKVFSVTPLSEAQMAKLQEKLSDLVKAKVKLENELDPSLIGGLVVQVEGKIFDASYKRRIEDLSNAMNREDIV